ncbi:hypothetical protein M885DRAFT_614738, partial [Pelagophyceae sp. CCMP2097]
LETRHFFECSRAASCLEGRPRWRAAPPSAAGVERGAVEVDGVTYKYTIHRKTWKLTVQPGFGGKRHGVCTILNGEVADEATFARRIRAARERAALKAPAPAQAPAAVPSPFHTRPPEKRRRSDPTNIGRDDVAADFPTDRPSRSRREEAAGKRKCQREPARRRS